MEKLTERESLVLDCITTTVAKRGYPPSIREIMEATGIKSTSTVFEQLGWLEGKEYIKRGPGARAITVLHVRKATRR